jgi:hypothetical protein
MSEAIPFCDEIASSQRAFLAMTVELGQYLAALGFDFQPTIPYLLAISFQVFVYLTSQQIVQKGSGGTILTGGWDGKEFV